MDDVGLDGAGRICCRRRSRVGHFRFWSELLLEQMYICLHAFCSGRSGSERYILTIPLEGLLRFTEVLLGNYRRVQQGGSIAGPMFQRAIEALCRFAGAPALHAND